MKKTFIITCLYLNILPCFSQFTADIIITKNIPCHTSAISGDKTGTLKAVATGGTFYTYNWLTTGATTQSITVPAGTYACKITKLLPSPVQSLTVVIGLNDPAQPTFTNLLVKDACFGSGAKRFECTFTTPTNQLKETGFENASIIKKITVPIFGTPPVSRQANFDNVVADGTYFPYLVDANDCRYHADNSFDLATTTKVFDDPGAVITDVTCFNKKDGIISFMPEQITPGKTSTYQLSGSFSATIGAGKTTFPGLSPNNYTVTITPLSSKCQAILRTYTVMGPTLLSISGIAKDVTCFGFKDGSVSTNSTGGNSNHKYLWNTANTNKDLTNIDKGMYTITVTDSKNCTASSSFNIKEPTRLDVTSVVTDNKCFGEALGKIIITATGGNTGPYKYEWDDQNNQQNRTNLKAATYMVSVTDSKNCLTSKTIKVIEPSRINNNAYDFSEPSCFRSKDGFIVQQIKGGTPLYRYLWNDGSKNPDLMNISSGKYSCEVKDLNNCIEIFKYDLFQPDSLRAEINKIEHVNGIHKGSIDMNIFGGFKPYVFNWTGPNGFKANTEDITNLETGAYKLELTDIHKCISQNLTVNIGLENSVYNNFIHNVTIYIQQRQLVIKSDDNLQDITFQILNLHGQKMNIYPLFSSEIGTYKINLDHLISGLYILQIQNKKEMWSMKFTI